MKKDGAIIRAYDLETVAEVSIRLNVSNQWVYELMRTGKLDYYEIGGRKLIHRRDVDSMLQQRVS